MQLLLKFLVLVSLLFSKINILKSTKEDEVNVEKSENHSSLMQGGYPAEQHLLYKYIVSLRRNKARKFFGDNHYCAGTLVSSKVIVTAAHCGEYTFFKKFVDIYAVAGSPYLFEVTPETLEQKVEKVIKHPEYKDDRKGADIALMLLEDDMEVDGLHIDVLPLATEMPKPGTKCQILGWGEIFNDGPRTAVLTYADLSVVKNSECDISDDMICLLHISNSEKGGGVGDTGSPLICDGQLTGLCSMGIFPTELKIVQNNMPLYSFYTGVAVYRNWILHNQAFKLNLCFNSVMLNLLTTYFI